MSSRDREESNVNEHWLDKLVERVNFKVLKYDLESPGLGFILSGCLPESFKHSFIQSNVHFTYDFNSVFEIKFDGTDFVAFWKMQIEDYLYQKKLYQPLSGHQPENMKDEDWTLLDRQALGVIRLTLSYNVAFNIAKEKTTMGLMTTLSSMYENSSTSNKVHLMRRLFNLWMSDGSMVAQHLNELNIVTTQLSSVGIEFDDEVRP
ncbi:uncharacterized protein LOC124822166 [Vigna umbellata]|uniref:uncharacterized protein LOC124822166 n=1 Tax=Vigna umbellata TaxID=87088 RepID=UPI001F5E969B|nr:uncharacterized protein LOC124822166 [Vigna umbellata]